MPKAAPIRARASRPTIQVRCQRVLRIRRSPKS